MNDRLEKDKIPEVSRWYRFDWQFAADLNRLPLAQEAAFLIAIAPIVVWVSGAAVPKLGQVDRPSVFGWLLWGSALAFVSARVLYYFACPQFIREYRDFGQYAARQHSHRWIVWEFWHNLKRLSGWRTIVLEASPKGLTVEVRTLDSELDQRLTQEFGNVAEKELKVFAPVNINRDIYLPIYLNGAKLALPMRENDPDLSKKEKELFWILYSQAAKERPMLRITYWILVGLALLLVTAVAAGRIYLALARL